MCRTCAHHHMCFAHTVHHALGLQQLTRSKTRTKTELQSETKRNETERKEKHKTYTIEKHTTIS